MDDSSKIAAQAQRLLAEGRVLQMEVGDLIQAVRRHGTPREKARVDVLAADLSSAMSGLRALMDGNTLGGET